MSAFFNRASKETLLVIHHDADGCNACVLTNKQGKVQQLAQLSSDQFVPESAIKELLAQCQQQKITVPKQAILVTAASSLALLDVEASQEQDRQAFLENIKWEMDGLNTEQVALWQLGRILIARGHLSSERFEQLLQEKQQLGANNNVKIGQLAFNAGYITREQLEDALQVQQHLHLLEGNIDCSWIDKPVQGELGDLWLACALNADYRNEWIKACRQQQIRLGAIYPVQSAMLGALPQTQQDALVVYVNHGFAMIFKLKDQQIQQLHQYKFSQSLPNSSVDKLFGHLHTLLDANVAQIYFQGPNGQLERLREQMAALSGRDCQYLVRETLKKHEISAQPWWFAPVLGAYLQQQQLTNANYAVRLQGAPPPPPLWRNIQVQLGGAAAAIVIGVIAVEMNHLLAMQKGVQIELASEAHIEKIERVNTTLREDNAELDSLLTQKQQLKQQLATVSQQQVVLNDVFINRQNTILMLVNKLSAMMPETLYINEINEGQWQAFSLSGWGSSALEIDNFNQLLSSQLRPLQLAIVDAPIEVANKGYAFTFQISRLDNADR